MTMVYESSREKFMGKNPIKQMECMIVMLLICVKRKIIRVKNPQTQHVFYNRFPFFFLIMLMELKTDE